MTMTMVLEDFLRTIKASEFKSRCLQLMDEVDTTGEEIIITKNGRPVSKLAPVHERPATIIGAMRDTVVIKGDIISPLDIEWEADR